MSTFEKIKSSALVIISYLFIMLFVYAAVSKLSDFHNFRIQVAQSPLLTAFAGYVSVSVVATELIISVLLSFDRTRLVALYCSFALMAMFSIYIYIILNYSPYVPCSCGGILEDMGWNEHLYFNIVFTLFAAIGIYIIESRKQNGWIDFSIRLGTYLICSTALMAILFISSEIIVHKKNNFVRRFPPLPAKRVTAKDLKFSSYYFAGTDDRQVYLGNYTAPGLVTVIDSSLTSMKSLRLNVTDTLFKFKNVQLRVIPPNLYLFDGTVPCIFKGTLENLDAKLLCGKIPGFTKAEIKDSTALIARTLNPQRENRLTKINLSNLSSQIITDSLLQKQRDGFFDTDGALHFDNYQKKLVYVYYYRNQYVIADENMELIGRGNTIDTTSKANIKTDYVGPKKIKKFSAPPLMVNRLSTLHRNLLFINSTLISRFESEEMWKQANVIDVYDINTKSYLLSFYVYKVDGDRPDYLIATDDHLFVIAGSKIISYRFSKDLKDKFTK